VEISTALPCRISLYEGDGTRKLATIPPTARIELYQNAELQDVAKEVEAILVTIMAWRNLNLKFARIEDIISEVRFNRQQEGGDSRTLARCSLSMRILRCWIS
jgi:hypothetical protein